MKKSTRQIISLFIVFNLLAGAVAPQAHGNEVFDMLLEELQYVDVTLITAGKKEQKVGEIPASVVIITRKDIETYGYTTLEDILSNIPGLYSIDPYYWWGTVTYGVRGFYSVGSFSDMVVMVNGVNQREDYYESYPFSKVAVPVEAIDRIEVIRGPMSVIYGNGAFFGAINIITNQTDSLDKPHLASISGGTGGDYRLFARATHDGEAQIAVNVSGYGTDGIEDPYRDMISDPAGLGAGLPNDGSFEGQLTDDRRYVDLSARFNNWEAYLSYVQTKKGISDVFPSASPHGHEVDLSAANASISYKKNFSEIFSLTGKFQGHSFVTNYDYEWFVKDLYGVQVFDTNSYSLLVDLFYSPHQTTEILLGAERKTVDDLRGTLDVPAFGDFYADWEQIARDPIVTDSLYSQVDYKPWKKLKAVAGVRLEKTRKYQLLDRRGFSSPQILSRTIDLDTQTTPRAALLYSLTDEHIVKVMYGKAVKKPAVGNQIDLVPFPSVSPLVPASMTTIEINIISTWHPKLTSNISVFQNRLKNLVSREQTLVGGVVQLLSRNAGKQKTHGVEVGLLSRPHKKMSLELNGSYQESKDEAPGRKNVTPGYAPRFLGYGKTAYHLTRDTSLAAVGRYVSEMKSSYDPASNARLGTGSGSYFIMDGNFRVENLFVKDSFINLRLSNVFNREIRYPVTGSAQWADKGTLGRGRMLLATLGYQF